jgi:hypothetical protein
MEALVGARETAPLLERSMTPSDACSGDSVDHSNTRFQNHQSSFLESGSVPRQQSHGGTHNFEYFLSHKKSHSKDGFVPGQIAKNLHDSLGLLGHAGWFDVDNLERITMEELRAAVGRCDAMVVFLNDETAQSKWCVYEWDCARELEVPVKVIVDMERYSKKAALALLNEKHDHSAQCTAFMFIFMRFLLLLTPPDLLLLISQCFSFSCSNSRRSTVVIASLR